MGKRGPKPQPTQLKILRGNPGKSKLPAAEPIPQPGKLDIPRWANMSALCKTIWRDTLKRLPPNIATTTDSHVLAQYCKAWETYLAAEKVVEEEGRYYTTDSGTVHKHPAVGEIESARGEIRRLAGLFGLSPSDRSAMGTSTPHQSTAVAKRHRARA